MVRDSLTFFRYARPMRGFDIGQVLKERESGRADLGCFLAEYLSEALGKPLAIDSARRLVTQGSLWSGNQRIKDSYLEASLFRSAPGGLYLYFPELPIQDFFLDPADVVYEDGDLLLVHKKSGVNTCPSIFSDTDCLSAAVQKYLDDQRGQGGLPPLPYRLNTINRLDRATGGLVFFAKNAPAEAALHGLFRERRVSKRYLAATEPFEGARDCYKIRDTLEVKGKEKSASTLVLRSVPPPGLEDSRLLFWTALPQTGRTHQIRIHFQRYLTPIVGDAAYGQGRYGPDQVLHLVCAGYRFIHPSTGRRMAIDSWKGFH